MSSEHQVTRIIDEIRRMTDAEQIQVINFIQQLVQARAATTIELADPPAVEALKKEIQRTLALRSVQPA
jgi:hypothetical protein